MGGSARLFPQGSVEKCVEKLITNVTRLLEPNYRPFCTRARRRPNHFAINTLTTCTARSIRSSSCTLCSFVETRDAKKCFVRSITSLDQTTQVASNMWGETYGERFVALNESSFLRKNLRAKKFVLRLISLSSKYKSHGLRSSIFTCQSRLHFQFASFYMLR